MKVVATKEAPHSATISFSRAEALGALAFTASIALALHGALLFSARASRWDGWVTGIAIVGDIVAVAIGAKLLRAGGFGFDRTDLGPRALRLASVAAATWLGAMLLLAPAPVGRVIPAGSSGEPIAAGTRGTVTSEPQVTESADAPATHKVDIKDDSFTPRSLTIEPGDTIEWSNIGAAPHTVSADTGTFESGNLDPGDDFAFTFEKQGVYFYYCKYHGAPGKTGMWGVVRVATGHHAVPVHAASAPPATSAGTSAPATHHVVASDNSFGPRELRVSAGDTVMWMNEGAMVHNVTSDNGTFSSGDLSPGSTFSYTFDTPGVYGYYCSFHGAPGSGMFGVVIVGEAKADVPHHPGGGDPGQAPKPSGKTTVGMTFDSFTPTRLEVRTGEQVTWVNNSPVAHTVTWEGSGRDATLQPGDRTARSFATAGRYYYFCSFHGAPRRDMWGVIVVVGKGGEKPPPVDPPDEEEPPPPVEGDANVSITDDEFTPAEVGIEVGETVVWTNDGERAHTVTAEDGSFDSGFMGANAVFEQTFDEPGTYYYFCSYHGEPRSGMWGVVNVVAPPEEEEPDPPASDAGLLLGLPISLATLAGAQLKIRRRRKTSEEREEIPVEGGEHEQQRT